MDVVNYNLREEILSLYKKSNNPGIFPCIFGVPFTIGSIACIVFAINAFLDSEIVVGLVCLLVAAPLCAFVGYIFGWGVWIDYIKTIGVIKKEKYTLVPAVCTSKSINKKYRYHDSADMEEYATWIFSNENVKYLLEDWRTGLKISPNEEYILIFIESVEKIDMIYDERSKKMIYVNGFTQ